MQMKFYFDLYVSDRLKRRKEKIIKILQTGKTPPFIYLITLAKGGKNHLELYPSLLMRQHAYEGFELFVAGIASGYKDALNMTRDIVNNVYKATGGTDIKGYLQKRQEEYEESGGLR